MDMKHLEACLLAIVFALHHRKTTDLSTQLGNLHRVNTLCCTSMEVPDMLQASIVPSKGLATRGTCNIEGSWSVQLLVAVPSAGVAKSL
jgi:hypothetical protein